MLRMYFQEGPNGIVVRIEGRFVKEFAEHARTLIGNSNDVSRFVLDLSEVTFVDAVGESVLVWLKEMGVRFAADSAYCRDVCERLALPMVTPGRHRHARHSKSEAAPIPHEHVSMDRFGTLASFSFGEES